MYLREQFDRDTKNYGTCFTELEDHNFKAIQGLCSCGGILYTSRSKLS